MPKETGDEVSKKLHAKMAPKPAKVAAPESSDLDKVVRDAVEMTGRAVELKQKNQQAELEIILLRERVNEAEESLKAAEREAMLAGRLTGTNSALDRDYPLHDIAGGVALGLMGLGVEALVGGLEGASPRAMLTRAGVYTACGFFGLQVGREIGKEIHRAPKVHKKA